MAKDFEKFIIGLSQTLPGALEKNREEKKRKQEKEEDRRQREKELREQRDFQQKLLLFKDASATQNAIFEDFLAKQRAEDQKRERIRAQAQELGVDPNEGAIAKAMKEKREQEEKRQDELIKFQKAGVINDLLKTSDNIFDDDIKSRIDTLIGELSGKSPSKATPVKTTTSGGRTIRAKTTAELEALRGKVKDTDTILGPGGKRMSGKELNSVTTAGRDVGPVTSMLEEALAAREEQGGLIESIGRPMAAGADMVASGANAVSNPMQTLQRLMFGQAPVQLVPRANQGVSMQELQSVFGLTPEQLQHVSQQIGAAPPPTTMRNPLADLKALAF